MTALVPRPWRQRSAAARPAGDRQPLRPLVAAAAVATVGVLPVFLTGALAVQVRADLGFDEAALGLTGAAFFGAGAVASAASGRLAERLGPAGSMRLSAAVGAASLALVAVAARSFPALLACLVVGGVGNALAQPATNLYLARTVGRERLGLAFGVKQSAIPCATLLGGIAVPAVALTVGWRWAYVLAAVAALACLPFLGEGGAGPASAPQRGREGDVRLGALVWLAAGVGLGAASAGAIGAFLTSAAVDAGIGEASAGLLVTLSSALGVSTRLYLGVRADRRGGRNLVVVAWMLASGVAAYGLLATTTPAGVVAGAVAGYTLAWAWPGLFNLAIVRNNPTAPGAATGITQTGTYIGAVAGPILFGAVAGVFGFRWAWCGAGAVSLLAATTIVRGRRLLLAGQTSREPLPPQYSSRSRRL
jgi:MFS family permease